MTDPVGKFSFYESFKEAAGELPDGERLAFYDAITDYAFYGVEPDVGGIVKVAFMLAKPNIDASIKRTKTNTENARSDRRSDRKSETRATDGATAKASGKAVAKPTAKATLSKNKDIDRDIDRDKDRDTDGMDSQKNPFQSVRDTGVAAAANAAPPASRLPDCPVCDFTMFRNTQTGRFQCPNGCSVEVAS